MIIFLRISKLFGRCLDRNCLSMVLESGTRLVKAFREQLGLLDCARDSFVLSASSIVVVQVLVACGLVGLICCAVLMSS